MIIFLDFETHDPLLKTIGSGWCLPKPNNNFKVLGAAISTDSGLNTYLDLTGDNSQLNFLVSLLDQSTKVVMHNAAYDLGCLVWLGYDINKLTIVDTLILAKLYDNRRMSYKLDTLGKIEFGIEKDLDSLIEAVFTYFPDKVKQGNKTSNARALSFAYSNMDKLQEKAFELVANYAMKDIEITKKLYEKYHLVVPTKVLDLFCKAVLITVLMRKKGIKIDLDYLIELRDRMLPEKERLEKEIKKHLPDVDNLNSPVQLKKGLLELGCNLKVEDSLSTGKIALEQNKEDFIVCDLLLQWRKINKLLNDFVEIPLENSIYTGDRVYPQLNVLGATRTGRFSCNGPNLQQIPKKDDWGIRKAYLPDEGQWHSIDWSSQEPRLQVHYAYISKLSKTDELVTKYKENPALDLHQMVADIAGIQKKEAKIVNLGLSYGMGIIKLCQTLGYSYEKIKGKIYPEPPAQRILDNYHQAMPYLSELSELAQKRIQQNGGIKTLSGRICRRDDTIRDPKTGAIFNFDYKALNKLIQGSAADQAVLTLVALYDKGILPIMLVHDEFCVTGSVDRAILTKETMENAVKLSVPMVAVLSSGSSWGMVKEIETDDFVDELLNELNN